MRATDAEMLKPIIYFVILVVTSVIIYFVVHLLVGKGSNEYDVTDSYRHTQRSESVATTDVSPKRKYMITEAGGNTAGVRNQVASAPKNPIANTEKKRSERLNTYDFSLKKSKKSEAAVTVVLKLSESCTLNPSKKTRLPILYRIESPTIRTSSLTELRKMISHYRDCDRSMFYMSENPVRDGVGNGELAQLRFDELKYFFTQNSVPKSALNYPE